MTKKSGDTVIHYVLVFSPLHCKQCVFNNIAHSHSIIRQLYNIFLCVIPFYLLSVQVHIAICVKLIQCHVEWWSVALFCNDRR
jgi:hypothetical protein